MNPSLDLPKSLLSSVYSIPKLKIVPHVVDNNGLAQAETDSIIGQYALSET